MAVTSDSPPPTFMIFAFRITGFVEVHSRCHVASYLKKKRPDLKVVLYLHNDPRDMKGSRSTAERRRLLREMAAVICVSDYIRDCFLDGIDSNEETEKVATASERGPPTERNANCQEADDPVGRQNGSAERNSEFSKALSRVVGQHPEWEVVIAGARRFEASEPQLRSSDCRRSGANRKTGI